MKRHYILIDTSVLCEILDIPGKAENPAFFKDKLESYAKSSSLLILPLATILETGNHIAHIDDGRLRRDRAEQLVELVQSTLSGKTPFSNLQFWKASDVESWMRSFPEFAQTEIGLGDVSIIKDCETLKSQQKPKKTVSIWAKDNHLQSYGDPLEQVSETFV